jgi:hypothetical protein
LLLTVSSSFFIDLIFFSMMWRNRGSLITPSSSAKDRDRMIRDFVNAIFSEQKKTKVLI